MQKLTNAPRLRRANIQARLLVGRGVAIHLVHANGNPLHAQQVDETRVLARLALNSTCLVIALREIGSTGVFFSTKSFFHPTFTNILFISLATSS